MKRIVVSLIASSFLLASCIGNASLWGQYLTPTPVGWIPDTSTPQPEPVVTDTSAPVVVDTATLPPPSATPTSLLNPFVSQNVTVTESVEVPPTADGETILYYAQGGDWLPAVASRFGVSPNEITSPKILPENGFIDAGTLLIIPDRLDRTIEYTSAMQIIPDSELVFSATAADFDIEEYVRDAGGYLATYR
ncbi:MAG: hypothetical protein C3F07_02015, partial [Anaerolineales bacterium]